MPPKCSPHFVLLYLFNFVFCTYKCSGWQDWTQMKKTDTYLEFVVKKPTDCEGLLYL
jgi:hypothetical protein